MFSSFAHSAPVCTLGSSEVHLWLISVEKILRSQSLISLSELLCIDERNRVVDYRSEDRRKLFIVGRAALRTIISSLIPGVAPKEVRFSTGTYGKLGLESDTCELHFNLSHSHDAIVIAVARNCAVGVDVEFMQARSTMLDIARHYFHSCEYQVINEIQESGDNQGALRLFYKFWTLKEAFIKADGRGMSIPSDSFFFNDIHAPNPRIEFAGCGASTATKWSFTHQFVDDFYSVALALGSSDCQTQITVNPRQFNFGNMGLEC